MTSRDFAFWLQGFLEVTNTADINRLQTEVIRKHLNLVFYHEIDPSYTEDVVKQEAMNQIHGAPNLVKPTNTAFPHEEKAVFRC